MVGMTRSMIRFARRAPATMLGGALILTLGVGACAAVLGFLLSMAAPALPGDHGDGIERLVRVPAVKTWAAYRDLAERVRTVDLAVYHRGGVASMGRGRSAAPLRLECISHTYLDLLNVGPAVGRTFAAREDVEGAAPLVLLGHGVWTRRFAADPSVIGTVVEVNGRGYTVIGVMPKGFGGVEPVGADAWTLLAASPRRCLGVDDWAQSVQLKVVGRIRDGFGHRQVAEEVAGLRGPLDEAGRTLAAAGFGGAVEPLYGSGSRARSREWRVLRWFGWAGAVVMLLVCGNVSVLLALDVARRRDEIAVRLQLGAQRGMVFGEVLLEALALGLLSAAPAMTVAAWMLVVMEAFLPVGATDYWRGWRGGGVVVAMVLGAGLLSGIVPAAVAAGTRVNRAVAGGAAAVTGRRRRLRDGLVAAQIGVALVLTVVAWLFVRSAAAAGRGVGYDLDHVIVVSADLQRMGFDEARSRSAFGVLRDRVQRVPGVVAAALSTHAPLGFETAHVALRRLGGGGLAVVATEVSPSYFEAVGTRVLRGRDFDPDDLLGGRAVMIVSEGLAERLWPSGDALGSCAFVGFGASECSEVVGVSEQRRSQRVTWEADEEVFFPLSPRGAAPAAMLVRSSATGREALSGVAAAVRGARADLPFVEVHALSDVAQGQVRVVRLAAVLGSLLGGIVAMLAVVGIHAAIGSTLRERGVELGIRMALGASPAGVAWLVGRRGVAILVGGWVAGVVVALVVTPVVGAELFGVTPRDPGAFLRASALVGVSASSAIGLAAGRIGALTICEAVRG